MDEQQILEFWKEHDTFKKSVRGDKRFVFYDGPPFATGLPHYGHLVASTLKDVVPRYWAQNGYKVERRWGWDCHGLPIEYEIEKALGIKTKKEVDEYGIAKYNEKCRDIVLTYRSQWRSTIERLGRWVDFDNDYKTMDKSYMESVWWVFKTLYDKGMVYKGTKVMPYSMGCGTPLSNFEATSNYKDVSDPSVVLKFRLIRNTVQNNQYILVWTTTPWTLPSNLALCVHPDLTYVLVDGEQNEQYWICEDRVSFYFKDAKILEKMQGRDLVGMAYLPLFPYYFDSFHSTEAFTIVSDTYVSSDNGTGIVHMAPAFGEDDHRVCLEKQIITKTSELPCPIDANGCFVEPCIPFKGLNVKDADKPILRHLKDTNSIFDIKSEVHSYPYCWRSDTPLIYRSVSCWFISVTAIKDRMVELNQQINWVPDNIGKNRFANWLNGAKDWCVSRNRFWGTPLPIWKNDDTGDLVVVGSVSELETLAGLVPGSIQDIHRHKIDDIKIQGMTRVDEVFDCWFESGSMPFAQEHYPFKHGNGDDDDICVPADFIAEGLDQTRGWFYTLLVLSTAILDKPMTKNVIVNGLVLASSAKGGKAEKMSKSKRNYTPPDALLDKYGADALRLYLLGSPVCRAEPVKFNDAGVHKMQRDVIIMLENICHFTLEMISVCETYGSFEYQDVKCIEHDNIMDKWILSCCKEFEQSVHRAFRSYKLYELDAAINLWIDRLSRWYLKLNKQYLKPWNAEATHSPHLSVLLHCVHTTCVMLAPVIPFKTESIYQRIRKYVGKENEIESVHLCQMPCDDQSTTIDRELVIGMNALISTINMGRVLRSNHKVALKKPVAKAIIVHQDRNMHTRLQQLEPFLLQELNVMNIEYSCAEDDFMTYALKLDFKKVGKRLKRELGACKKALQDIDCTEFVNEKRSPLDNVDWDELIVERIPKDGCQVLCQGDITLVMDFETQDEEMILKYHGKLLVRQIQEHRKSMGLRLSDQITFWVRDSASLPKEMRVLLDQQDKYVYPLLKRSISIYDTEGEARIPICLDECNGTNGTNGTIEYKVCRTN